MNAEQVLHIIAAFSAGVGIAYWICQAATWVAKRWPIRERPCSVADHHHHKD